jgi:hypothetical protein
MAEVEHPEKYNWWLNELDSLGISTLQKTYWVTKRKLLIWQRLLNRHFMKNIFRHIAKVTYSEAG